MQFKINNQEDFWAGLMFVGFGVLAIYVSLDYPMGSAMRMGPGYFPTYLGALMAILGSIVVITSIKSEVTKVSPFAWKPMILLSAAFVIFGWGIDHIGFVPALAGLIVLSAAAGQVFRLTEVLIMTVVLVAGAVGIFIYGIELPYPLFWWR